MKSTSFTDEAKIALGGLADFATDMVNPTIRLGVTGLSRAGKTVFITALVHNLVHGGRLPMLGPYKAGWIQRAYLQPQPDDDVPRFAYEDHVASLTGGDHRQWPQSTRLISELRLTVEYEPQGFLARTVSGGKLNIDIVDYPGEWLLDLPLLDLTYAEWCERTIIAAARPPRDKLAVEWIAHMHGLDPFRVAEETAARQAAVVFTEYLKSCRGDDVALSTLPPGRFLMPGDLEGSPLITFAPLAVPSDGTAPRDSLWSMMERRYDSYVDRVVKPFFMNHFARLDRQIVLVDALTALNAGSDAVADLRDALRDILACFRLGRTTWLNAMLGKKIDRILFAATKADHLHHTSHDRLEAILNAIVEDGLERSTLSGSEIDVVALASVRATREAKLKDGGEELPSIVGTPIDGETLDGEQFDGRAEAAIFPGDLPDNPSDALSGAPGLVRFLNFRPPLLGQGEFRDTPSFPHIRLDKALNFLIGDRFS